MTVTLAVSTLPLGNVGAVSYGSYGSMVLDNGQDFNPTYAALAGGAPTICSRDLGTIGTVSDDLYYLNMDGAGTVVGTFDLRLTTAGGFSAGSLVVSGDNDVGQSFNGLACAAFAGSVRYLETDGLPGWTGNDQLVWSTDATLGIGDVRIAVGTGTGQESQSVTAGTVVGALTDGDVTNVANNNGLYPDCTTGPPNSAACVSTAVLMDAGSFLLRWFDANLNGAFDTGDHLVLAHTPAGTPAPTSYNINDVFLYRGAASTLGTRVTNSQQDHISEPEVICAGAITRGCMTVAPTLGYNRVLGADSNCDRLWIHFRGYDGVANVVMMDDVVLYMPSSGLTTCPSPPTASSVSPGTRVTTAASHLQGTAFTAAASALTALIFYVDANGNGVFDLTDPVYIDKPAAFGGGALATVTPGDFRVTSVNLGTTFTAGSIVGPTDTDINTFAGVATNNEAGKAWFVRKTNVDGADEIPLQTVTNVKYAEQSAPTDTNWQPATEEVYIDLDSSGTVTAGDIRLHAGDTGLAAGPTTAVVAGNADIGQAITSSSNFKVTGGDTTFEDGRGEAIYFSRDSYVNDEDFVVQRATGSTLALGQVAAGCAANVCRNEGVHTTDVMYFSWCPAGGCPGRLLRSDVQVSPTMGTRFTSTSGTDFVPSLQAFPGAGAGGTLIRYNRGEQTNVNDDIFYLSSDGATVTVQDVRATPSPTKGAGTFVASSDNEELTTPITATAAGGLAALIGSRDVDGVGGYSLGDHVYIDNPPALGGGTAGVLSVAGLRLTPATLGGSSFTGGTIVQTGNADLVAGTAFTGLGTWTVGFYDDNLNGVFDDGDVAYALPPGSPGLATLPQPPLGAVRLAGPGGATGGGATGGGGGVTPPPPPPPPQNVAASITITQPANGAFVQSGQAVSIGGFASGGVVNGVTQSISAVTVTVGGNPVQVTGTNSWSASFIPSDGSHTILATVSPASGSPASSSVTINANAEGRAETPEDRNRTELRNLIRNVTDAGANLTKNLAAANAASADLSTKVAALSREAADQTKQLQDLNAELAKLREENADLRKALADAEEGPATTTPGFEALAALGALALAVAVRRRT